MLLGLLSLISLAGGVPDDLRQDGVAVLGCTSIDAMRTVAPALPGQAQQMVKTADMLQGMADATRPVWFVIGDVGGTPLPTQIVFHLEEGRQVPGFLRMMPGSPRIEQDGSRVVALLGPRRQTTEVGQATLARLAQSQVEEGCTAVAPVQPGLVVGMGFGVEREVRVSVPADALGSLPQATPDLTRLFGALADALQDPAEPRRRPWASTIDTPDIALRLNVTTDAGRLSERLTGERIEALDKVVIEPGAEVALWRGSPGIGRWALVVPVRKPRTVRWWPGRIAKRAREDGLVVKRIGKAWGVKTEQGWVWITARRRRLLLSSDSAVANQLRDRSLGTAWAEPVGELIDRPGLPLDAGPPNSRLRGHMVRVGDDLVIDGRLDRVLPDGAGG